MNNFLHIKKHKDNSQQNSLSELFNLQNKRIYILIAENIQSIGILLKGMIVGNKYQGRQNPYSFQLTRLEILWLRIDVLL